MWIEKHVDVHDEPKLQCDKNFGHIENLVNHVKLYSSDSGAGIGRRNGRIKRRNETESGVPTNRAKVVSRMLRVRSTFKAAAVTYRLFLNQNNESDAIKDSIFAMERKIGDYQRCSQALKLPMAIHTGFVKANNSSIETIPFVVLNKQPF